MHNVLLTLFFLTYIDVILRFWSMLTTIRVTVTESKTFILYSVKHTCVTVLNYIHIVLYFFLPFMLQLFMSIYWIFVVSSMHNCTWVDGRTGHEARQFSTFFFGQNIFYYCMMFESIFTVNLRTFFYFILINSPL